MMLKKNPTFSRMSLSLEMGCPVSDGEHVLAKVDKNQT